MTREEIIMEITQVSRGMLTPWKVYKTLNKRNGYQCLDFDAWDNLQYAIIDYLLEELVGVTL